MSKGSLKNDEHCRCWREKFADQKIRTFFYHLTPAVQPDWQPQSREQVASRRSGWCVRSRDPYSFQAPLVQLGAEFTTWVPKFQNIAFSTNPKHASLQPFLQARYCLPSELPSASGARAYSSATILPRPTASQPPGACPACSADDSPFATRAPNLDSCMGSGISSLWPPTVQPTGRCPLVTVAAAAAALSPTVGEDASAGGCGPSAAGRGTAARESGFKDQGPEKWMPLGWPGKVKKYWAWSGLNH
jgi:hypothetical protein